MTVVITLYTRKELVRMAGDHRRHSFDFRGDLHPSEIQLAHHIFRIPRSFRHMLKKVEPLDDPDVEISTMKA